MNNTTAFRSEQVATRIDVAVPLVYPENIPEVLRSIPQWVGWRYQERRGRKPAKVPINPRTGARADVSERSTWGSLQDALFALDSMVYALDGIGFVLTKDLTLTVLDADSCFLPDGKMHPKIEALVARFATYTEYSPSGRGLHVWILGVPQLERNYFVGLEVYYDRKYITVTGKRVPETRAAIENRQEQLNEEVASLATPKPEDRTASQKRLARNGRKLRSPNAADLQRLLDGDLSPVGGDHSRADFWAARFLSRVHGPNLSAIDDEIRRSNLVREKWFEKRRDTSYGTRTIKKAFLAEGWLPTDAHHHDHLEGLVVVENESRWGWGGTLEEERDYLHHHQTVVAEGGDRRSTHPPQLVPVAYGAFMRETPRETNWIVEGLFAPGATTLLEGPPKEAGKTTFLLWCIRAITAGQSFLERQTRSAKILFVSEQTNETLRPMLEDVGLADEADFHLLLRPHLRGMAWQQITRELERLCRSEHFELILIDTLPALAGLKAEDENKSGVALEIMGALAPVVAERAAVVATRHERKSGGRTGEAGRGSSAYTGCADLVLSLRPAPGSRNYRVLDGIGRFSHAVPVEELIDWHSETGYSKVRPREGEVDPIDLEILAVLSDHPVSMSIEELVRALEKPASTVRRSLDRLRQQEKVRHAVAPGRGREKRYSKYGAE